MSALNTCAHCNEPANLKCSACGCIYYCDKEHQKLHWKLHKDDCVAYKLEENAQFGRYLVANRDIKAGSVIMKKSPLVAGPKMMTLPVCLGCHRGLLPDYIRCSFCNWALCSIRCEKSKWHSTECKVLAYANLPEALSKINLKEKTANYAIILPLRAMLLKASNKKRFDELMGLQSHIENNMSKPIYEHLSRSLLPLLKKLNIPQASDIDPLQVCSIFDTNAFEVRNTHVNIRAVYPMVSFLPHNCTPNTRHLCDEVFAMSVIATRDICKGEQITTTYTQSLWPTLSRRKHLRRVKHFDCVCPRCSDPTELQTFAGSLKCQMCGDGFLLSREPLNNEASWECQKCKNEVGAYQVETMNAQIRREILSADRTIESFEEMLNNYTHLLHGHNSHSLEIKYALVQLYEVANRVHGSYVDAKSLKRRVELCQELLKVSSIFEPGCSTFNEVLENSKGNAQSLLSTLQMNE